MKQADVQVLYTGTDPISVKLRDGRLLEFTPERPLREVPADSAQDLLSPAINGGRFRKPVIPSAFPPPAASAKPAAEAAAAPQQVAAPPVETVSVPETSVPVPVAAAAKPASPRRRAKKRVRP